MLTIPNGTGAVTIEVTVTLGVLCKIAHEPQPGSTLTWRYTAADRLLALQGARAWPASQVDEPLDLETFTRRAAMAAAEVLSVPVETIGQYILKDGTTLRCHCQS